MKINLMSRKNFIKIGPVNVTKVVKLNKSKQFQILNANFDNA